MTSKAKIKFGTDGWRGLIARDFTFNSVSRATLATAEVCKAKNPQSRRMIVGYDRRFLSRAFAETAAAVCVDAGYEVLFAQTFLPTPILSWCAKHEAEVAGAIIITASHNPPSWNGFKFKEPFGGSALPSTTNLFEQKADQLANVEAPPPESFERKVKEGKIHLFDPRDRYFESMIQHVDANLLQKAKLKIGLDVMNGSASDHYPIFLSRLGVTAEVLHNEENPGFRSVPPEPIEKNLSELRKLVPLARLACGLATDGDADRLAAVAEDGSYFTTQQILSVIYWHMVRRRKRNWSIARSVSTTRMVDLIAQKVGRTCYETPVGFKFIAEKMVEGKAEIGGEESGGVGLIDHLPDRDGLLTGLLLLEIIATEGKGLKQVYEDLCKEMRPYYFRRLDLTLTAEQMKYSLRKLATEPPTAWEGRAVDQLVTIDGYKFYLKDGSWILIRPSGTEPLFRLYAEAETDKASERLVLAARDFVEK